MILSSPDIPVGCESPDSIAERGGGQIVQGLYHEVQFLNWSGEARER
ncbi:hypothetical protein ISM_10191 [Roseovarius nubinhibens ISM]|uniref:Uncharacterized protein n=1 Tax=Roseovarius nubinhibens (strain ATCC BAA-591 / DSM 15170 / ISM) TaxID=89187 RepID=A3SQS6_ROSNI|nr:hypothetical protein ISM_10191 [Roseovarius nubinhibens ISM]